MADNKTLLGNARREVLVILAVNLLALVWTVGYCYLFGYQHEPESWVVQNGWATSRSGQDFQQVGGLPDWIFVGVFLPWLLCSVFTIGLCMGFKDDDLGAESEVSGHAGH